MQKIFISAGEQSGDFHGSNLICEILRKDSSIGIYGLGGDKMICAGMQCIHNMTKKSVMWVQSVTKIHEFFEILSDTVKFFKEERPKLAILLDYCGLNFYIAKSAKKLGIPVMYYISPQVWAHGGWRVKKLKKLVDKMVVIYPFEEQLYKEANVPVKYVGNPIGDEISKISIDEEYILHLKKEHGDNIISLFPGSRKQEITKFLPILLKTASLLYNVDRSARFIVSCSDVTHSSIINEIVKDASAPVSVVDGNLAEIVKSSKLCFVCSGTVTLKIAYYLTPMIIIYRISSYAYFIAKPFMQSPYLSLVNRLAEGYIVPERLMFRNDYKWLISSAIKLLNNMEVREKCIEDLKKIKELISCRPGVSKKVADEAISMIV